MGMRHRAISPNFFFKVLWTLQWLRYHHWETCSQIRQAVGLKNTSVPLKAERNHSELVYPPTFDILIMGVLTSIFWSGGKSLEMGFPVTAESR